MGNKPSEIAFEFGEIIANSYALAIAALTESSPPRDLKNQISIGSSLEFPIRARDLNGLHGKQLGDTLKKLKSIWIKSDFTLTKKDLMDKI
jgi:poly(A) polymerase